MLHRFTTSLGLSRAHAALILLLGGLALVLVVAGPPGGARAAAPVRLTAVTVTPTTATLAVGGSVHLTATARYDNGSTKDVTGTAGWSSSSRAVTVAQSGGQATATGAAAGTATVTAKVGHVSGDAAVTVTAAPRQTAITHVVWIMMENHSASAIIGSASAPYINSLARQYGLASNYWAVSHPSLPNYLAATSGLLLSSLPVTDCTSCRLASPSIFTQGESWKAYQESMGVPCKPYKSADGLYVPRHNPPLYYTQIPAATCQADDVDYSNLANDLARGTLPAFSFVTPNLAHDMHDGTVAAGDAWLAAQLPAILGSQEFTSGSTAVFVTWDEGSGTGDVKGVDCLASLTNSSCQVALLAISPYTKSGTVATSAFSHYSLLRTTQELLQLPLLGVAATAPSMRSVFGLP